MYKTKYRAIISLHIVTVTYVTMSGFGSFGISLYAVKQWANDNFTISIASLAAMSVINSYVSFMSICWARQWSSGNTNDSSCPFDILRMIYSGKWVDRGGQVRKAKWAIAKAAGAVLLSHSITLGLFSYVISIY